MDAEVLAGIGGVVIQLAFAYIPKLSDWYDQQVGQVKGLVQVLALFLVAAGALGLACINWFDIPLTCDNAGLQSVLKAFFLALAANQGIYLTVVKPSKASHKPGG